MINIGEIYKFTYQSKDHVQNPKSIVYGIVLKIQNKEITIIPLNGFLGDQYKMYNIMNYTQKLIYNKNSNLSGKIISHQTSYKLYNKFLTYSKNIIKGIFINEYKF